MKSLDGPEGALLSINATKGEEDAKDESWHYRYVVVDNPKISLAKQLAYYKALNLPCAALVNTGANSVQAWVKINAQDHDEFDERVNFLFNTLDAQGFKVDSVNKNPNQMVRMLVFSATGNNNILLDSIRAQKILRNGRNGWNIVLMAKHSLNWRAIMSRLQKRSQNH
jgi:hypothetical protein